MQKNWYLKRLEVAEKIIRDITSFTMTLIDDISQDNAELKKRLIKILLDKICEVEE